MLQQKVLSFYKLFLVVLSRKIFMPILMVDKAAVFQIPFLSFLFQHLATKLAFRREVIFFIKSLSLFLSLQLFTRFSLSQTTSIA
jgi:hypothetical protein